MSIASRGEWRGTAAQKRKKIRNRWVSLRADTQWFQEQQKLSLPKSKEGKPLLFFFFTCVALKCEYQRASNAEFKTRYNCKRLSQPINIERVGVRLGRSLHALVPQINCRDAASARGHFPFKYLHNTTEIRHETSTAYESDPPGGPLGMNSKLTQWHKYIKETSTQLFGSSLFGDTWSGAPGNDE